MIRKICLVTLSILMLQSISAQKKMTVENYIKAYKGLAIDEMKRAGVPASITMAQAILESDSGGSPLAVEANNHFGIKCQVEWTGPTIKHDDDAKGECFRKYEHVAASFKDHSDFLTTRSRYASLFDYAVTDYKSWATGLKAAGYATNPQYANMLIKIIEDNSLHLIDAEVIASISGYKGTEVVEVVEVTAGPNGLVIDLADPNSKYTVEKVNKLRAIRAKEGDTFAEIAAALRKKAFLLAGYNELPFNTTLKEGQVVYLMSKHKKAIGEITSHVVEQGESMHSISQKYGIRVHSLYKINRMEETYQVKVGERLLLK